MTAPTLAERPPDTRERITASFAAILVTVAAFVVGLLFAVGPLALALTALALFAVVISVGRPQIATYVVITILYSNAAAVAVNFHGLSEIGLAFPLLLALPLSDQLLLRRRPVTVTAALPYFLGYLLVQVIAAAGASDAYGAADNLINFLIGGIGMYFVITNVVRTYGALRNAVWTVLLVSAALGALSTFQAVTKTYSNDYAGFSTVDVPPNADLDAAAPADVPRAQGPIGEKNRYGQVLLVVVPLGVMLALSERRRWLRFAALAATLLVVSGIATTYSRGAALGLVAMILVAMLFRYVKPRHVILLGLLAAVTLVAFPRYGERLLELQGLAGISAQSVDVQGDTGNLRGRATATIAALLVWADHPLFGVGRGQFEQYYAKYAGEVAETGVQSRIRLEGGRQAHNLYASIAAETGIFGLFCFLAIFVVILRDLYRAWRRRLADRPEVAHVAVGFFLAVVGYLVSGIGLHLSYERYLWFVLALAAVAGHLALRGDPNRDFEVTRESMLATRRPAPPAASS
jgi:putative inorganic carbon (HCO3(-)) transporter